jgi:hypothetical protein
MMGWVGGWERDWVREGRKCAVWKEDVGIVREMEIVMENMEIEGGEVERVDFQREKEGNRRQSGGDSAPFCAGKTERCTTDRIYAGGAEGACGHSIETNASAVTERTI